MNNFDPTIVNGEFVPDTWGEGLDKLPYPAPVKDAFKRLKKEWLAIDFEKRKRNCRMFPDRSDEGIPAGNSPLWDGFGASSWGSRSEDSPAAIGVAEMRWMAGETRKDDRYTWPGGLGALSKHLAEKQLQPSTPAC